MLARIGEYDAYIHKYANKFIGYKRLQISLNPLAHSVEYTVHLAKIFILKCERIIEKFSIERLVYESVDDRSL